MLFQVGFTTFVVLGMVLSTRVPKVQIEFGWAIWLPHVPFLQDLLFEQKKIQNQNHRI